MQQQQYELHTDVRLAIDALGRENNHDARTQSPRLSPARLQLTVGRRGVGPRDQEEQRTHRASFGGYASFESEQQQQPVSARAGLGCLIEENTT